MTHDNTILLDQYIGYPLASVWAALTDPELHAQWFAAGDVRPVLGHRFDLDLGEKFGKQTCEVIAVEAEALFAYTFAPTTINTIISWRLKPEGQGTRLYLEHSGFDLDSQLGQIAFYGMKEGWPFVLERIEGIL